MQEADHARRLGHRTGDPDDGLVRLQEPAGARPDGPVGREVDGPGQVAGVEGARIAHVQDGCGLG